MYVLSSLERVRLAERGWSTGLGALGWWVSGRKPYKSDLSDERRALIEPVITAWKAVHPSATGRQGRYEMREIVNAILYQDRTGCQWDYLPHDLPSRGATYYYFAKWRDDGTTETIHGLLRCQVRELTGPGGPYPGGARHAERARGRQRAGLDDGPGCGEEGPRAQARARRGHDGPGHRGGGARGQIIERNPAQEGFVPQAKRWVAERAYEILMLHRRLACDCEALPATSESRVRWAMIDTMTHRPIRTSTTTWRGV